MNKIFFIFNFLLLSFFTSAQKYIPVDQGSKVHFVIRNFGINTGGDLSGLKGDVIFTPANISASIFNVSVNVNTIDTDNGSRDSHLKSNEFFDAEKYPVITIKSTKINNTNKSKSGWYFFTGTLTMHGVTKPILFPFQATAKGTDYLFIGEFQINRLDYGVGTSSSVLSNTVKISLSVLGKKG